jgi:hypothetical protein
MQKGVQPGYACPSLGRNTPERCAVRWIEIPGNGPLVDAALGVNFSTRFNHYVPVLYAEPVRAIY